MYEDIEKLTQKIANDLVLSVYEKASTKFRELMDSIAVPDHPLISPSHAYGETENGRYTYFVPFVLSGTKAVKLKVIMEDKWDDVLKESGGNKELARLKYSYFVGDFYAFIGSRLMDGGNSLEIIDEYIAIQEQK